MVTPTTATGLIPDDYPEQYVDCRLDRHSWASPLGPIPINLRPPIRCFPRYRVCRCGCWWIRGFTSDGVQIWQTRRYPEQLDPEAEPYLLRGVGGAGRRPRSLEWRRWAIEKEGVELYDPDLDPDLAE